MYTLLPTCWCTFRGVVVAGSMSRFSFQNQGLRLGVAEYDATYAIPTRQEPRARAHAAVPFLGSGAGKEVSNRMDTRTEPRTDKTVSPTISFLLLQIRLFVNSDWSGETSRTRMSHRGLRVEEPFFGKATCNRQ